MSKVINDFYLLSELLDDNMELVAILIHKHHTENYKLSRIEEDIEHCGEERLKKYHVTIIKILEDIPLKKIKIFKALNTEQKGLFDE